MDAVEATEAHLLGLGFDPLRLTGSKGFTRIEALRDAVEAIYGGVKTNKTKPQESDESNLGSSESKRRFEILARVVFTRFKSLLMEPSVFVYAERHDNTEAIYKNCQSDVIRRM